MEKTVKKVGEFQEVKSGNHFTFGNLSECPDTSLENWAKEQSWYDQEVHFSFICMNDYLDNPCRLALS